MRVTLTLTLLFLTTALTVNGFPSPAGFQSTLKKSAETGYGHCSTAELKAKRDEWTRMQEIDKYAYVDEKEKKLVNVEIARRNIGASVESEVQHVAQPALESYQQSNIVGYNVNQNQAERGAMPGVGYSPYYQQMSNTWGPKATGALTVKDMYSSWRTDDLTSLANQQRKKVEECLKNGLFTDGMRKSMQETAELNEEISRRLQEQLDQNRSAESNRGIFFDNRAGAMLPISGPSFNQQYPTQNQAQGQYQPVDTYPTSRPHSTVYNNQQDAYVPPKFQQEYQLSSTEYATNLNVPVHSQGYALPITQQTYQQHSTGYGSSSHTPGTSYDQSRGSRRGYQPEYQHR